MHRSCFSQVIGQTMTGNQWNNDRSDRPGGPDRSDNQSERWPISITITEPKLELPSAVSTGYWICHQKNVCSIVHTHMCRKEYIYRQRRLNHYDIGVGRGEGWLDPSCITHFKEGGWLMNEQEIMTKKMKMNPLLAHSPHHILLCWRLLLSKLIRAYCRLEYHRYQQ